MACRVRKTALWNKGVGPQGDYSPLLDPVFSAWNPQTPTHLAFNLFSGLVPPTFSESRLLMSKEWLQRELDRACMSICEWPTFNHVGWSSIFYLAFQATVKVYFQGRILDTLYLLVFVPWFETFKYLDMGHPAFWLHSWPGLHEYQGWVSLQIYSYYTSN